MGKTNLTQDFGEKYILLRLCLKLNNEQIYVHARFAKKKSLFQTYFFQNQITFLGLYQRKKNALSVNKTYATPLRIRSPMDRPLCIEAFAPISSNVLSSRFILTDVYSLTEGTKTIHVYSHGLSILINQVSQHLNYPRMFNVIFVFMHVFQEKAASNICFS